MSSSGLYARAQSRLADDQPLEAPTTTYLEVRPSEGGAMVIHDLDRKRLLIGRAPNADLPLVGNGVSRYHVELLCDSRGLWWAQDLGSTNGTLINGRPISNVVLFNYGDALTVGEFLLFLRPGRATHRQADVTLRPPAAVSLPKPDSIRLIDVSLEHSMATNRFVTNLQHVAEAERRRELLCEYAASQSFAGASAAVVRLDVDGNVALLAARAPEHLGESPQVRDPANDAWQVGKALVNLCRERRGELFVAPGPVVIEEGGPGRVIVCPLLRTPLGVELFCMRLSASVNAAEWLQLISFLVDGAQRSDELWRLRDDIRRTAKLEYELFTANQIQKSLIPRSTCFSDLELSFSFNPSRFVGGDYVDSVTLKDGRVLLTVADVCGKGLQAALVTVSVHTLVHVLVDVSSDLPTLVRDINRHLHRYLPDHSFVTMMFVAIDTASGQIECINAGHPPAIALSTDGRFRQLQSGKNVALGIMDFEPESERSTLGQNEILFMYTDGLSEASSPAGDTLGLEALMALSAHLVSTTPDAELDLLRLRVEQAINTYQAGSLTSDDCAFLLARLPPLAKDAAAPSPLRLNPSSTLGSTLQRVV